MDVMLTFDNHKNKICQNIFINAVLFKKEAKHFASHQSLVTSYQSLVASYQSLVISYQSLFTSYQSLVASYQSLVASYQSLVTSHELLANTSHQLLNNISSQNDTCQAFFERNVWQSSLFTHVYNLQKNKEKLFLLRI